MVETRLSQNQKSLSDLVFDAIGHGPEPASGLWMCQKRGAVTSVSAGADETRGCQNIRKESVVRWVSPVDQVTRAKVPPIPS